MGNKLLSRLTNSAKPAELSRRGFLVSMTAAGVAFGFPRASLAAMDPAAADGVPVAPTGETFEPSLWYWIDSEGKVNVNIIRAEMGQHVGTAIARILADELEVVVAGAGGDHVEQLDDAFLDLAVVGAALGIFAILFILKAMQS